MSLVRGGSPPHVKTSGVSQMVWKLSIADNTFPQTLWALQSQQVSKSIIIVVNAAYNLDK